MVYTRCQRLTLAILIGVAFVMLALGGGLGYMGGHKVYDGGVDLMTQAVSAVEEMESLNTNVAKAAFTGLSNFYSASSGGAVNYDDASVTSAISKVKKTINDAKTNMKDVQDIFNYALPGFYGFCLAISLLGFFSWWCGNGCCSMTMGMMSSVMLFLTWLLFIVFWVTGVFLDDTCLNLSTYYHLDCMKEPGKTCQQDKLTEFFQCPKISTVSTYYAQAYNMVDTDSTNGAGTNQYGADEKMLNGDYGSTNTNVGVTIAPAKLDGTNNGGTISTTYDSLAMEPWTTCPAGASTNKLYTTGTEGNRRAICLAGGTNTGTAAPQNANLVAVTGSTNPPWGAGSGNVLGSCDRACLNSSATSGGILDSLTNFGGNSMYRKFVYESFTTAYSSGVQGYATCGASGASSKIAWQDNTDITDYALYQNTSNWMSDYSALSSSNPCVPSSTCPYTTTADGLLQIPYATANPPHTNAGCLQAAFMAVADIMYALSYIASCQYLKTFARLTAVQSSGACYDLGDGLVYLITAQGLIGCAFFITTVVGVMGYRRFNSDYDAAKKGESHDEEDLYEQTKTDQLDDPEDQHQPYPTGSEVPMVQQPGVAPSDSSAGHTGSSSHDAWV